MREMGRGTVWCVALLLFGLPPVHTSGELTQGDLGFKCTLKEVKKDMPLPTIIFPEIILYIIIIFPDPYIIELALIEAARLSKPSWTSP